jgi:hypothetical protein
MVIFPDEDGLDVVISGEGEKTKIRHRHFDCRTSMIAILENLRLLTPEDAQKLEDFCLPQLLSCLLGWGTGRRSCGTRLSVCLSHLCCSTCPAWYAPLFPSGHGKLQPCGKH